jgi:hypothetical protein
VTLQGVVLDLWRSDLDAAKLDLGLVVKKTMHLQLFVVNGAFLAP